VTPLPVKLGDVTSEAVVVSGQVQARRSHGGTFGVLAVGVLAYSVLQSLVSPVLPTIQHSLHTSQNTVTWVLTIYLLSASVFTPIFGRIGDKIGKKRVFVFAMAALAAGSLLAAVTTSIGLLIAARTIQGIGGATLPLCFGIIRDEFPPDKVGGAVGVSAALTAVGGGLGIVLAGPIVENLGYHWLFWIPLIVTSLAAVAAHFMIPESPVRAEGSISVVGGLLLTLWLVALLLAVSEGSTWGWASGKTLGLIGVAAVIAVIWYVAESRSKAPLIDMQMMRKPAVWTNNLVALLFGAGMYSAMSFLPEFVQTPKSTGYGFGASITGSSLFMLPLVIGMFICGMMTGRLGAKFGSKLMVFVGAVLSTLGYALIAFAHSQRWEVFVASGLMGVAFGVAFSAMSNLIVIAVPPEQTGVATGMNANIRTIGGSIGAAVTGTIVTAGVVSGGLPQESGYTHAFAVLAGFGLLASIAVPLIPGARRSDEHVPEQAHAELALVPAGTLAGSDPE
jgi:EmrB/QacA subfamily drug resistance transporter